MQSVFVSLKRKLFGTRRTIAQNFVVENVVAVVHIKPRRINAIRALVRKLNGNAALIRPPAQNFCNVFFAAFNVVVIDGEPRRRDGCIAIRIDATAALIDGIIAREVNGEMRIVDEIYFARVGDGFDLRIAAGYVAVRNGHNPIDGRTPRKPLQYSARIIRRLVTA